MSALLRIFFVATLICVNSRVHKRGFSVKPLQALEACTRSQREFIFSRCLSLFLSLFLSQILSPILLPHSLAVSLVDSLAQFYHRIRPPDSLAGFARSFSR